MMSFRDVKFLIWNIFIEEVVFGNLYILEFDFFKYIFYYETNFSEIIFGKYLI